MVRSNEFDGLYGQTTGDGKRVLPPVSLLGKISAALAGFVVGRVLKRLWKWSR